MRQEGRKMGAGTAETLCLVLSMEGATNQGKQAATGNRESHGG